MIIKKLTLHNFGVYASTNTFDFNSRKPIVLIGGLNGRGKTTFLEAILLSLYGSNSFAYKESRYHTYGQYLHSYVNRNDGTLISYVELKFQMDTTDDTYIVHREWSALGQRTREEIRVKKNNQEDEFLTRNWSMFIESVLPSALSNYFFFDGDKIVDLSLDNTNELMKESIRSMLGISVLDRLHKDLTRNSKREISRVSDNPDILEMERLRAVKDDAENGLKVIDDEIVKINNQIIENQNSLEKYKNAYTSKGGDAFGNQTKVLNRKIEIKAQLIQSKENLLAIASEELPLALVKDLIVTVSKQAHDEQEMKLSKRTADRINEIYKNYDKEKTKDLKRFIDYFINQVKKETKDEIYNVSERTMYQADDLSSSKLNDTKLKAKRLLSEQKSLQKEADKIESYLSLDINGEELKEIYRNIKANEQREIDLNVEKSALEIKHSAMNGRFQKATTELNRYVDIMLKDLENNDDTQRVLKYSEMAIKILDEYTIRLQKRKTEILANCITDCYKKLLTKKNLIDRVLMDPVSLDLSFYDKYGNQIMYSSFSAGEKQLMVISVLWSLALCSKKKLPVIIDTPLSRLDSKHRETLITKYFPKASDQTIILSTDSEINQHYYELMKKNVGDEFTLIYNDDTRSTLIQKGYFKGE